MKKDELLHYGVLGMKWGKRKAGRTSADYTRSRKLKKKTLSELSDDDLTSLNKRLNLEKNYRSLNPTRIQKGQNAVKGVLKGIGATAGAAASMVTLAKFGQQIIKAKG